MLVDKNYWQSRTNDEYDTQKLQELYLRLNNSALVDLPNDLHVTTHVCRGNYHSTWAASGGYEPVADSLLGHEAVEAFSWSLMMIALGTSSHCDLSQKQRKLFSV